MLYPSLADVLAAHGSLIILSGGAKGIRDDDLDAYHFLMQLYDSNQFCWERFEPWLRHHAKPAL